MPPGAMPPDVAFPGVFLEEIAPTPAIEPASTSVALFVGAAPSAPAGVTMLHSFADFTRAGGAESGAFGEAVRAFFRNGGRAAYVAGLATHPDGPTEHTFAEALVAQLVEGTAADGVRFNLLCVPGFAEPETVKRLQSYCAARRAFYIVDGPLGASVDDMLRNIDLYRGVDACNAALYFPWVTSDAGAAPPCGFVAGVYARTDAARGVWKAPAGLDAPLHGAVGLSVAIDDRDNERLNPQAVNCLRAFPGQGLLVWGARTLAGNEGGEWKYVPVRRLALFIEQSLDDGLQWAVFEPNGEPLWARIRLSVQAFLNGLFRQGAFAGATAQDAYFVRCDRTTMTQHDVDAGVINVSVGFAPSRPAEFVVIALSLRAQS